ncbi:hypothetical protein N3K66_007206 [Trichothecium roseum]|uniref:Uncharacterized protein n=1 Tax=Trichothecium roseum TaxID=47278 RepID=A0ACC0UT94_9HYPO|nr:hypothetical protein N3K66_007206 [Trichothecium roseum]
MNKKNTSPTPYGSGRWVIPSFGGPDVLEWQETDVTEAPGPDSALVRILVAGIAGTDNLQRVGGYPNERCAKPGFTPGYDFVGEIVALGSETAAPSASSQPRLAKGDRVTALCTVGAHATHIYMPLADLVRVEPTDDAVAVCALPLNYMTAYGMLRRSGVALPRGSTVLIGSASGGVGTAVAQVVRAFDLGIAMIGTCSPSKFDFVRELGVQPVDRHAPDLAARVRALTPGGRGVDVAFDAVGSEESLRRSHEATRDDGGKVLVIGVMSEIRTDGDGLRGGDGSLDVGSLLRERARPWTVFFSMDRDWYYPERASWVAALREVLARVREGSLAPVVARRFRLSEAVEAHRELVAGANVRGKMVFVVDEELAAQEGI